MLQLHIRPAVVGDYQAIETIMRQVHSLHVSWRPDVYAPCEPVLPPEYYAEAIASGLFFVAVQEGAVVGLVECQARRIERSGQVARSVLYVETLAVDEQHRGQGIGTALMHHARGIALQHGYTKVELQVNARNHAARQFYTRLGYTEKSINLEIPC